MTQILLEYQWRIIWIQANRLHFAQFILNSCKFFEIKQIGQKNGDFIASYACKPMLFTHHDIFWLRHGDDTVCARIGMKNNILFLCLSSNFNRLTIWFIHSDFDKYLFNWLTDKICLLKVINAFRGVIRTEKLIRKRWAACILDIFSIRIIDILKNRNLFRTLIVLIRTRHFWVNQITCDQAARRETYN